MGGVFSLISKTGKSNSMLRQNDSETIPEITAKEKAIIYSTWSKLDSRSGELATDIFLRIFVLRPDVKVFFPFRTEVGDALVKHPYFKSHSMRFINAVRMTITNMDAWEVIHIPNLRTLGQHHTRIPGFTHDIFQVFYYAMNDVWAVYLGKKYTREIRTIWCKIFKFIIDQVEIGYMDELDKNRNKRNLNLKSDYMNISNISVEESQK